MPLWWTQRNIYCWRTRCLSMELVETKTGLKGDWILDSFQLLFCRLSPAHLMEQICFYRLCIWMWALPKLGWQHPVPHPARNRRTADAAAPRMCCSSYTDFVDHRCVEENHGSFSHMQKSMHNKVLHQLTQLGTCMCVSFADNSNNIMKNIHFRGCDFEKGINNFTVTPFPLTGVH